MRYSNSQVRKTVSPSERITDPIGKIVADEGLNVTVEIISACDITMIITDYMLQERNTFVLKNNYQSLMLYHNSFRTNRQLVTFLEMSRDFAEYMIKCYANIEEITLVSRTVTYTLRFNSEERKNQFITDFEAAVNHTRD